MVNVKNKLFFIVIVTKAAVRQLSKEDGSLTSSEEHALVKSVLNMCALQFVKFLRCCGKELKSLIACHLKL